MDDCVGVVDRVCSRVGRLPHQHKEARGRQFADGYIGDSVAPLYFIVRRPTYILDFSITLTFVHLILTSYYAKSFPTSLFFWVVQALGALLMIVIAEQVHSVLPKRDKKLTIRAAVRKAGDADGFGCWLGPKLGVSRHNGARKSVVKVTNMHY